LNYNKGILRLLGYYLAEGSLGYDSAKKDGKKYLVSTILTLNKNEEYIIEDVKAIVNSNFEAGIGEYTHPHRTNTVNLAIYNRSFAYIAEKLCGKYCDKKKLCPDLMCLEPKLQLEIAKGFFRGDGNFRDNHGETRYRGVTTSLNLAYQLLWILNRNGIKTSLSVKRDKGKKEAYIVALTNTEGINRLHDETIQPKNRIKNTRFIELENYFLIPIKTITSEHFGGNVFDLEVEEDHSYLANNLAVHNCMPESTVETLVDHVAEKYNVPLYRFPIDENNFEAGVNTRLETFISMLRRRRKG